jgi:hypothetical protein
MRIMQFAVIAGWIVRNGDGPELANGADPESAVEIEPNVAAWLASRHPVPRAHTGHALQNRRLRDAGKSSENSIPQALMNPTLCRDRHQRHW